MKKRVTSNLFMIIAIIVTTFVDYALAEQYGFITIMSPVTGLAIVYYFMKGNQVLGTVVLTYSVTLLISRFTLYDEELFRTFFIVGFKVVVLLFMMISIRFSLLRLKNYGYKGLMIRDIINYVSIGTVFTLIGASFYLIPIIFIFELDNALFWFGNVFIGYWFGYLIFGSTLSYSLIENSEFKWKSFRNVYALIFITISAFIMLLLITGNKEGFSIHHFAYIIFLLYTIGALFFQFRIILIFDAIFVGLYGLFGLNHSIDHGLFLNLVSINFFLLTLTATTVLLRMIYNKLKEKDLRNEQMNNTITELISATNLIFTDIEQITSDEGYLSSTFLSKVFKIGVELLPKFDKASLFVKTGEHVKYLDEVGYDLNHLNSYSLMNDTFRWGDKTAKIINGDKDIFADEFTSETFQEYYPRIRQCLRFSIHFEDKPIAGMSFDITVNNSEVFTKNDLIVYNEFSNLINGYFSVSMIRNTNNNLRNDIVRSLVRTLGLYDSYTGSHSEEVAFLTLEMSKRLNLNTIVTNRIYWSAIVHDIGKIGVDATVLNKTEELSLYERQLIEEHSMNGYNILAKSKGLEDIALRVKHHHERWDGKGYPDGLKGDEIPLCSQVLCVCDAVSAMAKTRVYSNAKTVDEIIGELYSNKGKQFSPVVVEKMVEYIEETKLIDFYSFKSELIQN